MNNLKFFLPLVIIMFLSYWAIAPFFSSGFFPMHDDTQGARVFEMHKALVDGMFPVRWSADLGDGDGFPIFNFYTPLASYIGAIVQLIGFDALIATKIMMASGLVLAAITMYYFAKEFWGKLGGIVSAVLYLYAPYHSVNTYVRGAVAELWAYAFVPVAFYGLYKIFLITTEKKIPKT